MWTTQGRVEIVDVADTVSHWVSRAVVYCSIGMLAVSGLVLAYAVTLLNRQPILCVTSHSGKVFCGDELPILGGMKAQNIVDQWRRAGEPNKMVIKGIAAAAGGAHD